VPDRGPPRGRPAGELSRRDAESPSPACPRRAGERRAARARGRI